MRQDPDVILIGEIRDAVTMQTALQAAETGHLVLASLHAKTVVDAINRVIDIFPPDEQRQARASIAESLQGVLCQHLVKSARGDGRTMVMEIAVVTTRVREAIADPDKTVTAAGHRRRRPVLRHAHVRAGRRPPRHVGRHHGRGGGEGRRAGGRPARRPAARRLPRDVATGQSWTSRIPELAALGLAELRAERTRCRRALELAQLRSRQPDGPTAEDVAALRSRVHALTEELIRSYAADLDLVDSLLDAAYPRGVGSEPAPAEGGAMR